MNDETLGPAGYETTDTPEAADLILLNTCHIREKAAEKVYSELGRLKPLKAANPDLRIAVAGCVAQAEGEEIVARAPMVDLVVGPQAYHRLPELEAEARAGRRAVLTEFPEEDKFDHLAARPKAARGPTAFVTVQEGCDKFCAFCVVPYTRGAEVSRPAATGEHVGGEIAGGGEALLPHHRQEGVRPQRVEQRADLGPRLGGDRGVRPGRGGVCLRRRGTGRGQGEKGRAEGGGAGCAGGSSDDGGGGSGGTARRDGHAGSLFWRRVGGGGRNSKARLALSGVACPRPRP